MRTRSGWMVSALLAASLGVVGAFAQTVQLGRVMRTKLEHSQQILGDLVTSNWAGLERHTEQLRRATEDPAWAVLTTPEYARQTTSFVRATEDLLQAARDRDMEAAPIAYVSLTLSCVQCHRYVARRRIAR